MGDFTGFTDQTTVLLDELGGFGRDDYAARKADINQHLFDPAKAFVADLAEALRQQMSPTIVGQAKVNGSISPLNNDLRFAKEPTPLYKDHLLMWFWDGPSKKTSPLLAVRITSTDVGFGIGMPFSPEQVTRWRTAIADDVTGAPFAAEVDRIVTATDAEVVGKALKRVPAPHDQDHPRGELLKHKGFQVRWPEPLPASFTRSGFVDVCARRLATGSDVLTFLKEHVA